MILYSEIDPYAANWLRNLAKAEKIFAGEVLGDLCEIPLERLKSATQYHSFAGIGGWPLALSMAGFTASDRVWTGSCPCQPFSAASRHAKGVEDERHLWPVLLAQIKECRPPILFGEQVAVKDGREWLAVVRSDLEALGYDFGAADLCAAGAGAPHIRQRLFFGAALPLANGGCYRQSRRGQVLKRDPEPSGRDETLSLAYSDSVGRVSDVLREGGPEAFRGSQGELMGNSNSHRSGGDSRGPDCEEEESTSQGGQAGGECDVPFIAGALRNPWGSPQWALCRDGKIRPIESRSLPVAYGVSKRVGKIRGFGNAIVPQVAAVFIESFIDALGDEAPTETDSPIMDLFGGL